MARQIRIQTGFAKGKEKFKKVSLVTPFATAIIDPDWPYTVAPGMKSEHDIVDAENKGRLSGFTHNREETKNTYKQRHPLSIAQLKNLRIENVVGGYIFLWTVTPFLVNGAALDILKAWGFEPMSMLTWAKYDVLNRHGYGGVGFWFLGNAEFCIVAKYPGYPSIRTGKSSLIIAPKGRHSAKPDSIHKLCEDRFPSPFVELFGRKKREGWTVIGDEIDGRDIVESVRDLGG